MVSTSWSLFFRFYFNYLISSFSKRSVACVGGLSSDEGLFDFIGERELWASFYYITSSTGLRYWGNWKPPIAATVYERVECIWLLHAHKTFSRGWLQCLQRSYFGTKAAIVDRQYGQVIDISYLPPRATISLFYLFRYGCCFFYSLLQQFSWTNYFMQQERTPSPIFEDYQQRQHIVSALYSTET